MEEEIYPGAVIKQLIDGLTNQLDYWAKHAAKLLMEKNKMEEDLRQEIQELRHEIYMLQTYNDNLHGQIHLLEGVIDNREKEIDNLREILDRLEGSK